VQEIAGIPKIANRKSNFLALQKSEFQKKNPTGIFGIINRIGIPPLMGVPEIGTKNRNSHPSCHDPHPIPVALILPIIKFIVIFTLYSSLFAQNYILFICICSGIKCMNGLIDDVLMQIPSIPRGIKFLIIR
jgi:hypothetical protein